MRDFALAVEARKSILHYDIKSKGAEAYLELAKEVVRKKPRRTVA